MPQSDPHVRTISVDPHPDWTPIPIAQRFTAKRRGRSAMPLVLAAIGGIVGLLWALGSPPTTVCARDATYNTCRLDHVYLVQFGMVVAGVAAAGILGLILDGLRRDGGESAAEGGRRRDARSAGDLQGDRSPGAVVLGTTPMWGMRGRPAARRHDAGHARRVAAPVPVALAVAASPLAQQALPYQG
jgi:hypothetical protein